MPPTSAPARTAHWLWPPLLLLGCVTALIAWILVALALRHQSGWMAVLGALEEAANWGIASAQLGGALGLDPWTSSLKMGAGLAWTLLQLANTGFDLACYVAALGLGWWASR